MSTELRRVENTEAERTRAKPTVAPRVDIVETPEGTWLRADMPGVDEKSVDITLDKNQLTIEGTVQSNERPGWRLAFSEFSPVDFRRVFTLSGEVNRDQISATVKDGVLDVHLPKAEAAKLRKIAVQAAK